MVRGTGGPAFSFSIPLSFNYCIFIEAPQLPYEEGIFPWRIITHNDMQRVMELPSNIHGQGSVRDLVMSCASSLLRYLSHDMTQDHIWDPPAAFRHLSSLRIPLDRRGEPSLLLHDLGEDPHAKHIELYRYVFGGPTSW